MFPHQIDKEGRATGSLFTRAGAEQILRRAPEGAAFRAQMRNPLSFKQGSAPPEGTQALSGCSLHISQNQAIAIVKDYHSDAAEKYGARVPMVEVVGQRGRITYIIG